MSVNQGNSSANHGLLSLAWMSGGIIISGMFWTAQLPPLRVTIPILAVLSVLGIASLRITELSIMSRLFVLLLTLPFSATLGYMFDREYVWWQTPTNVLLCQNHRLINEMLTMVSVGVCGMMAGLEYSAIYWSRPRLPQSTARLQNKPTLTLPVVWVLLMVSFLFSWLHAPEESIFTAAYASADAGGGKDVEAGLNASYLISYLILILIMVDAERERPGCRRQVLKLTASLGVMGYIVVVLQLLRGDRECAGLVAALGMLYITSPTMDAARARLRQRFRQMNRTLKLAAPLTFCVLAFLALGALRHSASATSSQHSGITELIIDGATQNTWTAVALNNLGLAADYNYGTIEYLYGQTYVDYVLSLPPGAVTKAMGYERPLEGDANPATWYFGLIAAGGMHPVVVPFKNFGIWGIVPLMFLCGVFICYCETWNEQGTLPARVMYGSVITSSMLWFWYGDMNMIRTLMAWAILVVLHQFCSIAPQQNQRLNPPQQKTTPQPLSQTPRRKPVAALS
jgi:hypothetical protein